MFLNAHLIGSGAEPIVDSARLADEVGRLIDHNIPNRLDYVAARAEELIARRRSHWLSPQSDALELREAFRFLNRNSLHAPEVAPLPIKMLRNPFTGALNTAPVTGWTYKVYLDYCTGEHHAALIYGDASRQKLSDDPDFLVRVHSSSKLSEIFFGLDNSGKMFDWSMQRIMEAGKGMIIYLEQDGRGGGVPAHLDTLNIRYFFENGVIIESDPGAMDTSEAFRRAQLSDLRDYSIAAEILRENEVNTFTLLTRSNDKCIAINNLGFDIKIMNPQTGFVTEEPLRFADLSSIDPFHVSSFGDSRIRKLRLESKLDAHVANVLADHIAPWETVAENTVILKSASKPLIELLGSAPAKTEIGDWTMLAYGDLTTGEVHRALVYGNADLHTEEELLMRVHSACKTNEIFNATNCECKAELEIAMNAVRSYGQGLVLYLDQEGRGAGIFGKMNQLRNMFKFADDGISILPRLGEDGKPVQTAEAYLQAGYPAESRSFSVGLEILHSLGVGKVSLLTNNPRKSSAFDGSGIQVSGIHGIIADLDSLADPELLRSELGNKRNALGHDIPDTI